MGGEEQNAIGYVLRLPGPAERHSGFGHLVRIDRRIAPCGSRYLCPDRRIDHAGMHSVDANIFSGCSALHRDGFGNEPHSSLGGAVTGQARRPSKPSHGRHDDDRTAARAPQGGNRIFYRQEDAVEIHGGLAPPVGQRHLDSPAHDPDPGIGDHHVQAAEALLSGFDHAGPAFLQTYVLMKERRCAAVTADVVDDRLTTSVVQVRYYDLRAFAGQCYRTGCADARWTASHDRNLALHLAHGVFANASLAPGRVDFSRCRVGKDPLNLVDCDAIKLGDLGTRHPIIDQSAHPPELRGWYFQGRAPFGPLRWRPDPRRGWGARCGGHWDHRRNSENARLARWMEISRRTPIHLRRFCMRRRLPWPEQVFRLLPRSIDPVAIVARVRILPVGLQR